MQQTLSNSIKKLAMKQKKVDFKNKFEFNPKFDFDAHSSSSQDKASNYSGGSDNMKNHAEEMSTLLNTKKALKKSQDDQRKRKMKNAWAL